MPKLKVDKEVRSSDATAASDASEVAKATEVTELFLDGFIDAGNYGTFEKGLENAYADETRFLIMDFSNVHYINSSGISAIIRFFEMYRARGGTLCLAGVPKPVGLSMHLLGLTSIVPFLKDLESAREFVTRESEKPAAGSTAGEVQPEFKDGVPEGEPRRFIPLRGRRVPGLQRAKVLVISPSKSRFTRVLRLRFKSLNGDYHLYHDAAEALQRYDAIAPDLVVIDERCDPTGDFVSRVKIQKERSLTSIIKLYKKQTDVERELQFKIWENDYLVEPFEVLELFSLTEAELVRLPKDRKVLMQQVRFEFKTTPENVEKAHKLCELIVRQTLPIQDDATALYAATKEGIDNAVTHGNLADPEKTVDVNFLVDQKKVTVIVEDEGDGFDFEFYLSRLSDDEAFEKAKRRIVEEGVRGGLGILLMHKCTDRIDYAGAGNVLRLEKNL